MHLVLEFLQGTMTALDSTEASEGGERLPAAMEVEGEDSNKKRKRQDLHHPVKQKSLQCMDVARIVEDD